MKIQVLLFGPQAVITGRDRVLVEVDGVAPTPASVKDALRQALPQLAATLDQSRLAINHQYTMEDTPLCESDEVALIGMVSGG
ncbi:MAG: MoaD/ThiS family protein [Planctomycetota bacterium]